jgi:hypothetical protein
MHSAYIRPRRKEGPEASGSGMRRVAGTGPADKRSTADVTMENAPQLDLDDISPAAEWDRDAARRALDDLFTNAKQYRSAKAFRELVDFVARFRFYSPFNAMLIHIQMSGAKYAAPAHRWTRDYRRRIKPGARPLVILQPMGPVMFVFDVAPRRGCLTANYWSSSLTRPRTFACSRVT